MAERISVPAHERKKKGRKPKGDGLPVREEIHELPAGDRLCPCCGEPRPEIGEDSSAEYDLVPAHVVKIVHRRKKYGPCACGAFTASTAARVLAAPGPTKIVPGSDFTNRSIAFFLTAKYADAIPFYRMERMLARSGLLVSRAGLCKLAVSVGRAIGDLIAMMNEDLACFLSSEIPGMGVREFQLTSNNLARSPVLLMDETTVQVLKEGLGPPGKKSYLCAVLGYMDGKPIQRFAYHPSRSGSFADTLLTGFSGYLQTDGYPGYGQLAGESRLVLVGCFAHIRRKFVTAWETAGRTGTAKEAIDIIARIYRIEAECRAALEDGRIGEDEFPARRKKAIAPVFDQLSAWLMKAMLDVAPQTQLGEAVAYAQEFFDHAIRFADHPLLRPDTNAVENAIRPFVVGRNYAQSAIMLSPSQIAA